MKSKNNLQKKIKYLSFFSFIYFLTNQIVSSKSFLEAAKDKVEEEFKYDSEEYRNEPASLNHEYYTKRGQEELEQCRNQFKANYNHCRNYKTCNFCSANSGCGWCDEKKICIPLDLNSQKDQLIPICMGDCIKVLKIEYCFKGLFEPDNTQGEVNFANYDQVVNQDKYAKSPYDPVDLDDDEDTNFENIMEKSLERNLIESQKIKKDTNFNFEQKNKNEDANYLGSERNVNENNFNNNKYNANTDAKNNQNKNDFLEKSLNLLEKNLSVAKKSELEASSGKLQTESLESKLSNEFKTNSFSISETYLKNSNSIINSLKPDCDEVKNGVNGVQNIIPLPNDPGLNFIPKSYTNYPSNIDLEKNSQKLYKEMAHISKEVFDSLLSKELKGRKKTNFIKANLENGSQTEEEFLKYLKEFIPNFEFPQFIKSDLEQSINDIKREKLLLWLRGFSLNDPISKMHLPIYKNLSFTNEDQIRKLFLDKFYKDIVKDKNVNVDSLMYRNMLRNNGIILPLNDLSKYVGKRPFDIVKDMKVIDSNFIADKDLIGLVKQSNMRFKEKGEINHSSELKDKVIINIKEKASEVFLENRGDILVQKDIVNEKDDGKNNKMKSLKEITNDLKDLLKEIK